MLIPDTGSARALILSGIILLSAVAPGACAYATVFLTKREAPLPVILSALSRTMIPILSTVVHIWLVLEIVFWICFLVTRKRLQKELLPKTGLSSKERTEMFWNCLHTIADIKTWSTGWYYYADTKEHPTFNEIYRENVALWFAWAFWHNHLDQVQRIPEHKTELEWMISTAEKHFNVKFPKGYNPKLQCIRLNLDPVHAVHRPLIFYVAVYLCTVVFNAIFLEMIWGFKQCRSLPGVLWGGFLSWLDQWWGDVHTPQHNASQSVVYWYRPVPGSQKTPIIFIHGIGAGPMCYGEFIHHLAHLDRPMFCVELPYVSMHMVETVPTAEETVKSIVSMLRTHGHQNAIIVSHSLGTAVTSWMMRMARECVAGVVLVDPICFLLHYHHVGFNFVHRVPKRALEHILYYGASRELHISYYISRHFQWFQTIFFVHPTTAPEPPNLPVPVEPDSPLSNAAVFLSEHDGIVDSPTVANYLKQRGVDARIMPGMEHAEFLLNWKWRKQILEKIEQIGINADDEGVIIIDKSSHCD